MPKNKIKDQTGKVFDVEEFVTQKAIPFRKAILDLLDTAGIVEYVEDEPEKSEDSQAE